ncbi:Indole-3-glycerol phosphate synthase [Rhynchospora pubera]|uniref:indole-3-glycerol-phosphate synthase n=1 Tax=Rhynchospora pubera TaxID=906938 RepID=A0AAV8HK32_9POAL|nr:Indole-3-glycerol phosphate synthase [Rhynchospora pubera]
MELGLGVRIRIGGGRRLRFGAEFRNFDYYYTNYYNNNNNWYFMSNTYKKQHKQQHWRSSSNSSSHVDKVKDSRQHSSSVSALSSTSTGIQDHIPIPIPPIADQAEESMQAEDKHAIRIRRRPPTGPPVHYVGPFQFRLHTPDHANPRNILEQILWDKDSQLTLMKERQPLAVLQRLLPGAPPVRDFVQALKDSYHTTGMPALIAELKKASPSKGLLRPNFDPVSIAQAYQKNGAACLSVLTDEKYFQGSFENLHAIRSAGIKCPLLCKEFIIDAWQIYYARSKGADAILLIAAVLPDVDIKYMIKICNMLGLAALVEVHDELEMDRVLAIDGVNLIGINNRNLETFEVDIFNTKRLLEGGRGRIITQRDILVVGESGLFTPEDITFVQNSGVQAVLVGESLIKQEDLGKAIAGLFGKEISVRT